MALAKRCDICGKYYDYYKKIPEKGIFFNTVDLCIKDEFSTNAVAAHNRIDCCPECANIVRGMIDNLWENGVLSKTKRKENE